jgi:FixJ family two-component response regulator
MFMKQSDDAVFVVDDDQSVREALRTLIRWMGLRCETFESAAAFLAAELPDAPSCLVLDVHLAGSSGLDLPAELGRSGRTLPIVFITGQGTIPMGVRAMKAGAVEFLTKPFDERDLLSAIEQALGRDRAEREGRAARQALVDRLDRLSARKRAVLDLMMSKLEDGDVGDLVRPIPSRPSAGP